MPFHASVPAAECQQAKPSSPTPALRVLVMLPNVRNDTCVPLCLCGLNCVSNVCVNYLPVKQTANVAEANASEEDKIKAIQSCHEYDPIK